MKLAAGDDNKTFQIAGKSTNLAANQPGDPLTI
jgi:hypothetical protein